MKNTSRDWGREIGSMSEVERRLLVKSLVLTLYVFAVVRLGDFPAVLRLARADRGDVARVDRELFEAAERAARRAWRLSPLPGRCLEIALTLVLILRGEGVKTDLRLGVNPDLESFAAHAWVEVPGTGLVASLGDQWHPVATL